MNIPERISDEDDYEEDDESLDDGVPMIVPQKVPAERGRGRPPKQAQTSAPATQQEPTKVDSEFKAVNQEEIIGLTNSLNELVAVFPRDFAWLRPIVAEIFNRLERIEQEVGRA
jgi:hypothetical protein